MTPSDEFDKTWDKGWQRELRRELGATAALSTGKGKTERNRSDRKGFAAQGGGGEQALGDIYGEAEEGNITVQNESTREARHRQREPSKEPGTTAAPSTGKGKKKGDGGEGNSLVAQGGGGDRTLGDIYGEAEEGNFTDQIESTREADRIELTPSDGSASWEGSRERIRNSHPNRHKTVKVFISLEIPVKGGSASLVKTKTSKFSFRFHFTPLFVLGWTVSESCTARTPMAHASLRDVFRAEEPAQNSASTRFSALPEK